MSRYEDIIDLPHHVSRTRPQMSLHDRAAQFAPFAALVGYDEAVAETATKMSIPDGMRKYSSHGRDREPGGGATASVQRAQLWLNHFYTGCELRVRNRCKSDLTCFAGRRRRVLPSLNILPAGCYQSSIVIKKSASFFQINYFAACGLIFLMLYSLGDTEELRLDRVMEHARRTSCQQPYLTKRSPGV